MATIAERLTGREPAIDHLSGTPRAGAIDRWIYVFTAASFILFVLLGFVPDSLEKIAAVEAGQRAPFPLVLHFHAVLMGSFMLLLLAQTSLVATGRCDLHRRLGLVAMVLMPALVVVGYILIPTIYHQVWDAAQVAPPEAAGQLRALVSRLENIQLLQIRIGILFPLFIAIALIARGRDAGLHKRMMILGTAVALPAAFDRIPWLWSSLPGNPFTADLYPLLAVAPMFAWDVIRNRRVHRAYWLWLAISLPFAIAVHALWDTPGWHAIARSLMNVG
jgi:hypothetical protein